MNDDLISRQAAIRWVKTECNPYGKTTLEFESGKRVIEHLKQMPAAQPERKKGKWIHAQYPFSKCNICENYFDAASYLAYFCPHCGADMRGEEHDN